MANPPQDPTSPSELTVEGLEDRLRYDDTRKALERAQRALARAKNKNADLREAIYQAAFDAAQTLTIPPVPKPVPDRRKKKASEVAVAVMGDWQLGKVTRRDGVDQYNSTITEERIERYVRKVIHLADIQRADHPVRECHVWLLGDIIEGVDIFPGQQWLVDSSLYRQIVVDGPRILGNALRTLASNFDRVHVTAIIGNHGRLGGYKGNMDPESNGDRMLYTITEQLLSDESRITWHVPAGMGERNWYAVDTIGNYSCLLFHGDQIRGGFGGFPFYGLAKKVWGWKAGAIPEQFKDVMFGHWHQNVKVTLNNTIARCNGSTESYNTYAQESLAAMGEPSQTLLFVHPERGIVTAEYQVWL